MSAYTSDELDRPLFGVSTRRERLVNLLVGIITSLCVTLTLVTSIVKSIDQEGAGRNIFFAVCIVILCCSLLMLIHWYRQGDVDPKFKKMIYFNSASIVLLCVCANVYFFTVACSTN